MSLAAKILKIMKTIAAENMNKELVTVLYNKKRSLQTLMCRAKKAGKAIAQYEECIAKINLALSKGYNAGLVKILVNKINELTMKKPEPKVVPVAA